MFSHGRFLGPQLHSSLSCTFFIQSFDSRVWCSEPPIFEFCHLLEYKQIAHLSPSAEAFRLNWPVHVTQYHPLVSTIFSRTMPSYSCFGWLPWMWSSEPNNLQSLPDEHDMSHFLICLRYIHKDCDILVIYHNHMSWEKKCTCSQLKILIELSDMLWLSHIV